MATGTDRAWIIGSSDRSSDRAIDSRPRGSGPCTSSQCPADHLAPKTPKAAHPSKSGDPWPRKTPMHSTPSPSPLDLLVDAIASRVASRVVERLDQQRAQHDVDDPIPETDAVERFCVSRNWLRDHCASTRGSRQRRMYVPSQVRTALLAAPVGPTPRSRTASAMPEDPLDAALASGQLRRVGK